MIFTDNKYHFKTVKKKCLLVENFNTFCAITDCFSLEQLEGFIIVWSKCNEITSPIYTDFLPSFNEVLCFFDFDLGGLRFIEGLSKRINNMTIYIPDGIDEYMNRYGNPLTDKQYTELVSKFSTLEALKPMASILLKHKKILEQETLQHTMEP